jgi:hypothetical protein
LLIRWLQTAKEVAPRDIQARKSATAR